MTKHPLLLLLLTAFTFAAMGQDKRVSFSTSYNVPIGQMSWSYKSAPDFNLSMWWDFDNSKRWTTGLGFGVGYLQFNPLADTLYYVADRGGVGGVGLGKAVYSPFKILKVSALMMALRKLNKKVGVEAGLDVAYYYGKRDIEFSDEFGSQNGLSELGTRAALVPRLGLSYNLGKRWSVTPFVSYTFMIEFGDTNPASLNYNPDTGKWLHYYSGGVALNYYF